MKKLSDVLLCFAVGLKEAIKYGLPPLSQLRKNPEEIKFEGFLQCLANIQANKRIQEK